jgi:preprotein translocase subunit SecD
MRRNNLFRTTIIVLAVLGSIYALYPTYALNRLRKVEQRYIAEIQKYTGITLPEIREALTQANLQSVLQSRLAATNGDTLRSVMDVARQLEELEEDIAKHEGRAIRQGLDLQGGIYMVYEVDVPQLLLALAEGRDSRLEELIQEVVQRGRANEADMFDVLGAVFKENSVPLNRYYRRFGRKDNEILDKLREEARDAVDRTLEVLRNRIDQFGVSEPNIAKQGDLRIVIELAGIQDVQRAKNVIGRTALLEFKLQKEPEVVNAVLAEINSLMRRQMKKKGEELLTDAGDTTVVTEKIREEKPVRLSDYLGEGTILGTDTTAEGAGEDTAMVDEEIFEGNPFYSLLARFEGSDVILVPAENRRIVERILNSPEVKKIIPEDAEFVFSSNPQVRGGQEFYELFLVKKEPELTGAMISDARVEVSAGSATLRAGQPIVALKLNSEGAKIFAQVTGANVGKRLAIILDGKVESAPVIEERIPGGNAIIRGSFTMQEAKDLAIVLRAGALPAPVVPIHESFVGPSLGRDSVRRGQFSAIAGLILVMIFMAIYYKFSGIIADVALVLNILFIMAVLASFHATLTLPGVAGIILTIGMAVDANVLIFERIREELRTGKTIRAAIDAGYARAFTTIMDANITTLLTALVLYQFGTGPIRGFAVTLSIGIVASMFTAIVVTRVIFDYITDRYTLKQLSI